MSLKGFIPELEKISTLPEIVEFIKNIYLKNEDNSYIPAIINEGKFTLEEGKDFYLKLVIKHQSVSIKKTWLKQNLQATLEEPFDYDDNKNDEAYIHNVITQRHYKSRELYQLNPIMVSYNITEYEYDNSDFVNAYFNNEYFETKGYPVLKYNPQNILMVYRHAFSDYLNEPNDNTYPKFELVAEFEYRNHNVHLNKFDDKTYLEGDSYLDASIRNNSVYILGSVPIKLLPQKENNINQRFVKVIDLHSLKPRDHNSTHYNGDTIEGFVCFNKSVIDVLAKNFYFYDLQIIDKFNSSESYLIDVLDDKVVFWEGEYNKIPISIKDEIDTYNFEPASSEGLISSAMSKMQLEASFKWDEELPPNLQLANKIRERGMRRAFDLGLTFIAPSEINEFRDFIIKIETFTNISIMKFNRNSRDVKNIIDIQDGKKINLNKKELELLYQKFCYAIYSEYSK